MKGKKNAWNIFAHSGNGLQETDWLAFKMEFHEVSYTIINILTLEKKKKKSIILCNANIYNH